MMGDGNMYWMNALIQRGVECEKASRSGWPRPGR